MRTIRKESGRTAIFFCAIEMSICVFFPPIGAPRRTPMLSAVLRPPSSVGWRPSSGLHVPLLPFERQRARYLIRLSNISLSIDDARKRTKHKPRFIFERKETRRFRANSVFLAKRQKFGALPATFLLTCGIVIELLMYTVFFFPDSPRRVLSQIGCDCTLTWLPLPGIAWKVGKLLLHGWFYRECGKLRANPSRKFACEFLWIQSIPLLRAVILWVIKGRCTDDRSFNLQSLEYCQCKIIVLCKAWF